MNFENEELEKYQRVINILQERLYEKVSSMTIDLYMKGLLALSEEKGMEFVDIDTEKIKFTAPKRLRDSEDLKIISKNLKTHVKLKMLVKYV